jgi:hypothetical protein
MEPYSSNTSNSNTLNDPLLVGMFTDRDEAERAYKELKDMGYDADEINVVMTAEGKERHFADTKKSDKKTEMGNKALEGTGTGAAIGGITGGIAGAIAAIGTNLIIPGLGLVVLGPLAAGLAGAGAGGLTGGIIGALVGAGIPKERAGTFERGLKEGNIMLAVRPHSTADAEKLTQNWRQFHADVVYE